MITIKDFMETVNYKITEGSDYGWSCFGPNAHCLDSWNGLYEDGGYTVTCVFDTKDQTVYEMEAYDYRRERAYRWQNPDYIQTYKEEAEAKGCDGDQAWDDVKFVDLEMPEDMLEKARAIIAGEDYDTRVSVPLTMDDDQLFDLMKLAHQRDITLNQLVENILREVIDMHETGTDELIDFLESPKKKKSKMKKAKAD